jgi:hypothetical protein
MNSSNTNTHSAQLIGRIVAATALLSSLCGCVNTTASSLQITAVSHSIAEGASTQLTAAGGVPPYTYSVYSGTGSVSSTSGVYTAATNGVITAPATSATSVVQAQDSNGNVAQLTLTITPIALSLTTTQSSVIPGATMQFVPSGGIAPYTFYLISGSGTLDTVGDYTAPSSTGTATVEVTDANGSVATANVTVTTEQTLAVTLSTSVIASGGTATVTTTGGSAPYIYTVLSGGGYVIGSTYTAQGSGAVTLQSTDALGNTGTISFTVGTNTDPIKLGSASASSTFPNVTVNWANILNNSTSSGCGTGAYQSLTYTTSVPSSLLTPPTITATLVDETTATAGEVTINQVVLTPLIVNASVKEGFPAAITVQLYNSSQGWFTVESNINTSQVGQIDSRGNYTLTFSAPQQASEIAITATAMSINNLLQGTAKYQFDLCGISVVE